MKSSSNHRNVLVQVILLPLILGTLLLATGLGGIHISRESSTQLQKLHSVAIGPTQAFDEIVATLNETSQITLRLGNRFTPEDEREALVKKFKSKVKKISKLAKEAGEGNKDAAYSDYLKKWLADWDRFQQTYQAKAGSYPEIEPSLPEIDKQLAEFVEKISNVNTFIQTDTQELLDKSTVFARQANWTLIITLAIGTVLALVLSTVIIRGVRRMLILIDDTSKKNMQNLLDNLSEGFLIIDEKGLIQPGVSKAATELFGSQLENAHFSSAVPVSEKVKDSVNSWLEIAFGSGLSFASACEIAPKFFERAGRYIELEYRPIYASQPNAKLEKIICIASDRTEERELRRRAEAESSLVRAVMKALSDRPAFVDFVFEIRRYFASIHEGLTSAAPVIDTLFRSMHSIKGGLAAYSFSELERRAHAMESTLAGLRGQPDSSTGAALGGFAAQVRKLEADFEAYLIKHESVFGPTRESSDRTKNLSVVCIQAICELLESEIGKESPAYRAYVETFLYDDIDFLFQRYQSVVSNVAERQMKLVNFRMSTNGIKVIAEPYMSLASSFVHVFRNAVDHGIEDPNLRVEKGKPETATVELKVNAAKDSHGKDILNIEVQDDGRGVDPRVIREKALEKSLASKNELDAMGDHEVVQLLFSPGFSTRSEVSELSGRGVGLDAVKYEVERLGGTVAIESQPGQGTRLVAKVPHIKSLQDPRGLVSRATSNNCHVWSRARRAS